MKLKERAEKRALDAFPKKYASAILPDGQEITFEGHEAERDIYRQAYIQGSRDTMNTAIAWLKKYAKNYVINTTPTFPDAPFQAVIGGMCWVNLRKTIEG